MPYLFRRLKDLLERGDDLPTLPTIVLQLHRVLDDPDAGAADVAGIIEKDPALTVRLLRAANSAAFSRGGAPVTSVSAAVARMGMNQVRAVCLVLAVVKAFGRRSGKLDHQAFWTHSATVAVLASQLWDRVGTVREISPDDAYVVGLLHDVGLLVLGQYFPVDLAEVLAAKPDEDSPIWVIEEEQLGLDHGAVAGLLLGRWSLPPFVAEAIANHHRPEHAPDGQIQLARVLEAAEALCWEANAQLSIEGRPADPAAESLRVLGFPEGEIKDIIASVPKAYERARTFLS